MIEAQLHQNRMLVRRIMALTRALHSRKHADIAARDEMRQQLADAMEAARKLLPFQQAKRETAQTQ